MRHDVQLFDAPGCELLSLSDELFDGGRTVQAAHVRYRAEGAGMVAPFADLQIRSMAGLGREHPKRALHVGDEIVDAGEHPSLAQLGDEPFHVRQAEEEIHLGNVLAQLILVALNHASDSHHGLRPAGFLVGARLEDRLNGLLLRGGDEAAGVHDDDLGSVDIRRDLGTVSHERGHHPLGVHRVLVTSERDQSDARAVIGTGQAYLVIDRFDIWVHVRANGIRGQRKDGKIPGPQPHWRGAFVPR